MNHVINAINGVSIATAMHFVAAIPADDLSQIVSTIVTVIMGLAYLWSLIKKPKPQ